MGPANKQVFVNRTYQDGTRRLERQQVTRSTGTGNLADTRYTYDQVGQVTSISETPTDPATTAAADLQCFRYDPLGHLVSAWTPGASCATDPSASALVGPAPYWTEWTYDNATSNRLTQTQRTASTTAADEYRYTDPAHPHGVTATVGDTARTYGYDADGATRTSTGPGGIATYTWNVESKLETVASASGTTRNIYDADGQLILTATPSGATLYAGPDTDITRSSAGVTTVTNRYSHLGQTVATAQNAANPTLLIVDHHNTATLAVDFANTVTNQRRFDPYGNPRGPTGSWLTTRGFLDGPSNTITGLTQLGVREYDPAPDASSPSTH